MLFWHYNKTKMSDNFFYRFGEILPALLSWGTLILLVVASFFLPAYVAIFIILFDLYWMLKTIYLYLYLRNSFKILIKNLKIDWLKRLKETSDISKKWEDIYHLIFLPMYNEPFVVVNETFQKLINANYPLNKFIIVLATEERAGDSAQAVAEKIKEKYGNYFFRFLITIHPKNIEGELAGKGSNQAWAGKIVKREIIDKLKLNYDNILVSVFDIDTQIFPDYFGVLTFEFLTSKNSQRASYQPVPLFTNNVYRAPVLARVIGFSATFWHLMQQSRPERLTTFSSHSMPFKALVEIGFWQTNMVSEDSRIFWQCYAHYDGDWRTIPLFYPVSMDANFVKTFWKTLANLYKQQRRWGWGAENIAYMLSKFRKNKKIKKSDKLKWSFRVIEGFHSWATNSLIIFSLGWLPVVVGGDLFGSTVLAYNLPEITRYIMTFASIGIITSAVLSIYLLPPKPKGFKKVHYVWHLVSWVLMPLTLIIFGSFPALEAQTRLAISGKFRLDFWVTPKYRDK